MRGPFTAKDGREETARLSQATHHGNANPLCPQQTVSQTSAPIWEEGTSFLIRKPHAESLELQVLWWTQTRHRVVTRKESSQWQTPVLIACGNLRQEDCPEFKASLG